MAIGSTKLGIDVEHGLHGVIAGRQGIEALQRVTVRRTVDHRDFPRRELMDIHGEERDAAIPTACGVVRGDARLRSLVGTDGDEEPAGHGLIPERGRDRDFEPQPGRANVFASRMASDEAA
jgi:hypothetical protein